MTLKTALKLIATAFVIGGINGVNVYLQDHKDFNLEEGLASLAGVFVVAGATGAIAHALKSPLAKTKESSDDGSTQ